MSWLGETTDEAKGTGYLIGTAIFVLAVLVQISAESDRVANFQSIFQEVHGKTERMIHLQKQRGGRLAKGAACRGR
jgi:hypothetical protein